MDKKCVITGQTLKSFGSWKEAQRGEVDGVNTNLGPVSKEAYDEYEKIITELWHKVFYTVNERNIGPAMVKYFRNNVQEVLEWASTAK